MTLLYCCQRTLLLKRHRVLYLKSHEQVKKCICWACHCLIVSVASVQFNLSMGRSTDLNSSNWSNPTSSAACTPCWGAHPGAWDPWTWLTRSWKLLCLHVHCDRLLGHLCSGAGSLFLTGCHGSGSSSASVGLLPVLQVSPLFRICSRFRG